MAVATQPVVDVKLQRMPIKTILVLAQVVLVSQEQMNLKVTAIVVVVDHPAKVIVEIIVLVIVILPVMEFALILLRMLVRVVGVLVLEVV